MSDSDTFPSNLFHVTLYFNILDQNSEEMLSSLDHHFQSDNWTPVFESKPVYVKNAYYFSEPDNFESVFAEFSEDLANVFAVSTNRISKACTCDMPFTGFIQLANLGHASFEVYYDKEEDKFFPNCVKFTTYTQGGNDAQALCDLFFS